MNSKNIIIGTLALAVVGGGAYFYFKNKKKGSLSDTLANSLTNTGGGTGTGTGSGTGSGTGGGTDSKDTPKEVSPDSLTDAQAIAYAKKYADLKQAFGSDIGRLKDHWIKFGKAEGRTIPNTPDKVLDSASLNQQETAKQIQAQAIVTRLNVFYDKFPSLNKVILTCDTPNNGNISFTDYDNCLKAEGQVANLRKTLSGYGYKDDNGIAVKL